MKPGSIHRVVSSDFALVEVLRQREGFIGPMNHDAPRILRDDLAALMIDREEESRLQGLLDAEYDRVAADFYQLAPRGDLR